MKKLGSCYITINGIGFEKGGIFRNSLVSAVRAARKFRKIIKENKMTDEELRIRAAELVGWEDIGYTYVSTGAMGCRALTGTTPTGAKNQLIPNYPHDIAAAWELWESIVTKIGGGITITNYANAARDIEASACLWDRDGTYFADGNGLLARAITRTSILAMDNNG